MREVLYTRAVVNFALPEVLSKTYNR
jgi:hypothetical protein